MTQHIKTHFKARGINSLANNPVQLENFFRHNAGVLSQYQITPDMVNDLVTNGGGFVPQDQDNNAYTEEQDDIADTSAIDTQENRDYNQDDHGEDINPC